MRRRKPWYRNDRGGWYSEFDGRQEKLAPGPKNAETEALAQRRFHELMLERLSNPPVDGGDPTVASVIDASLVFAKSRDAESTFYERKLYLQKFADAYGGKLVRECRPYDLTKWVDDHPTWRSDATKSYAVRTVKRAFNWAVQQELIVRNPFASIRQSQGPRRRPITTEELKKLLDATGPASRLGEIIRFMALTGCRTCEMHHLRWEQIDFDRKKIVLLKHKTATTLRTFKPRTIHLVHEVIGLLTTIRRRNESDEFVFVKPKGKPWARNSVQQQLRRLRRHLGLADDVVLYGLRHRFGTESIKAGIDLKTASVLLGHSTTRMAEHYMHLAGEDQHLTAAMARIAKSLADAEKTSRRKAE